LANLLSSHLIIGERISLEMMAKKISPVICRELVVQPQTVTSIDKEISANYMSEKTNK
jgi:hypothetical protein